MPDRALLATVPRRYSPYQGVSAMAIAVRPLHPLFFAEVTGVDLSRPIDDATFTAIVAASDKHAVLVFPRQRIDDDQQIAFSARLGPLETTIKRLRPGHKLRLDAHISDVSNLDEEGGIL